MKKFIYSDLTKAVAVILCIISVVSCVLVLGNGAAKYSENEDVYSFESDFSQAYYLVPYLETPERKLFNTYHRLCAEAYENGTNNTETEKNMESVLNETLNDLYCADKINYYVKWNDTAFNNCGATTEEDITSAKFYSLTAWENGNGQIKSSHTAYDPSPLVDELSLYSNASSVIIATSIKDDYADECEVIWHKQADIMKKTITAVFVFAVFAAFFFVYLICVCAKGTDGRKKMIWVDKAWTEVHIAVFGICVIFMIGVCLVSLKWYLHRDLPRYLLNMLVGTAAAVICALFINSFLSIVRKLKNKSFIKTSLLYQAIMYAFRFCSRPQKTGKILVCMLVLYSMATFICGLFTSNNVPAFFIAIILFSLAIIVVLSRANELDEIKEGAEAVRYGNTAYKIPISELKSDDMKILAENVNDIANGLDEAVSARVKAERLKTELITNVSHDLKTPITSIINYTELLSEAEGLSDEARDYVAVISKKSERLKKLTQDLFDISKVQSGNEDIVLEKLDLSLLINQSLGEHDGEIKESELTFCVDIEKELYISADGRKMSRVIGNLLENILKYSMKGTRVFVSAFDRDGKAVLELKNIASYPLTFNADEIVGRFVRADEARTTEGSGLGLAIAKSYTEVLGGQFDIIIDGDMFKCVIAFERY